ncbi:MAG: branched-chain amino acid transport system substrate-binding protein [Rhodobacteraceae bacterium HLUCCA12]|nr:MAG: branched-chain amino acid transport system substrate-binding protein [Rhodobacteraceae bacterium HLUCCA12]
MLRRQLLATAAVAALVMTAPASAQEIVKVGFVMSYSGWFEPIDASTIRGAMLAIDDINADGGVLGRQVEVVSFDNRSEPALGADGALEAIDQGAVAILFPSDFDFGAPGAFIAQEAGVISLSGASDPNFGVDGIGSFAYSISNAAQSQGAILAEWAYNEMGWRTAYTLLDTTIAFTNSLCEAFDRRWNELAGDDGLLGSDTFRNDDPTISSQVTRINGLDEAPDAIMLCSYAPGGPSAIRQLRAEGLDQPIMTGESLDGNYWIGAVPELSDFYVANYGSYVGDDPNPDVNAFFERYEETYDRQPDVSYGIRGYSLFQAWALAAERAGSFDAEAVAAELDQFDNEPLAIGPTTFTPELHIATTRPMTIMQAQDGEFSALGTYAPETVQLD